MELILPLLLPLFKVNSHKKQEKKDTAVNSLEREDDADRCLDMIRNNYILDA